MVVHRGQVFKLTETLFSLELLAGIPRFVYPTSFMSKIDDMSGYNHMLLSLDSQQYFSIEWQGWWLVGVMLPFGSKNSPFVYQTVETSWVPQMFSGV